MKKYSKVMGIILCVFATLFLLMLLLLQDFGIGYLIVIAFCYFVGIKNIRGAKVKSEPPAADPVIVTPEITVRMRGGSSSGRRRYSYSVYGVRYKNENGEDIQKLLSRLPREGLDSSVFYNCMDNNDIKDNLDEGDRVYIYDGITYDAVLVPCEFEGAPAVKVYFVSDNDGNVHIGWISKEDALTVSDMINKHDCSYVLEIEGGSYKELIYDEDSDKYKVSSESGGEYFAKVYISYDVEDIKE